MARFAMAALTVLVLGLPLPGCHPSPPAAPEPYAFTARSLAPVDDEVDGRSASRVEELLIGRFPGVHVFRTADGGFAVRIWRAPSLPGQRGPLYVVDGIPIDVGPGQGLSWLNPADVRSIRVLKNVNETAPYGLRGAAGVVVITTWHGGRAGRQ